MDTKPLERFATWARQELLTAVEAQATAVLKPDSIARSERNRVVRALETEINRHGREHVIDKVAYTWFNRIIALRFMDARGYTDRGVVSPAQGQPHGQPEILADAKRGNIDTDVITSSRTADAIIGLLDGTRRSTDAEGEAYALLLTAYCHYWHGSMPFMFEREGYYTELLVPANLLADGAILSRVVEVLAEDVCDDVEVIGWLYQFYISERKKEVFEGFNAKGKARKLAGPDEIPAATQLFTPHWIVRYLVENSLGRLWMLNRPLSRLVDQMEYYIAPREVETDFLKITKPEELTVIDPACGSGHMLTYAFDLLYAIYEEEGYAPSDIPGLILTHNLFGAEIDPRSGALAAFALTMKARERQRTFFNQQTGPNVCVIEPISFGPAELDFLRETDGDRDEEVEFWNQFKHADTYGSLIKPDSDLLDRAVGRFQDLDDNGDLISASVIERAERVVEQARYLSQSYAVAVANPPYMGLKTAGSELQQFVKKNFPISKPDLYATFIERCSSLVGNGGIIAMVTMQSWMFLSAYEKLRRELIKSHTVWTMAHLGTRAFDTIGGEVVSTTAFVMKVGTTNKASRGVYLHLIDGSNEAAKARLLGEAVNGAPDCGYMFVVEAQHFEALPGAQFAYWLPENALNAYRTFETLGQHTYGQPGLQTSDNARFTRQWFEVSQNQFYTSATNSELAANSGARWFPLVKGGDYRKWYGNLDTVVNWKNNGSEIKSSINEKYPYLNGNVDYVVKDRGYFFRECITYNRITTGRFAVRYTDPGTIFDVAGSAVFPNENKWGVLGFLCSTTAEYLMRAQNPTFTVQSGDVAALPYPATRIDALGDQLIRPVQEAVSISREDWDSVETSWRFSRNPLLDVSGSSLASRVETVLRTNKAQREQLAQLECTINQLVANVFGLGDVVKTEVSTVDVSLRSSTGLSLVRDLVSYAVGCMFGRYSLDKSGLVLGDQEATLQDYLLEVPSPIFSPDSDNVIPIVDGDWFEDDIVERFRQFLRTAFGEEHFEANLRFVEESLGVKMLRDYFITKAGKSKFYDDHVQRYKKRPIYWMFSSPKGSFNALIYLHRYTPSTVSTVLNEYLREYRGKLEIALQNAEREAAVGGSTKMQKEAERIRKILVELAEYEHDVLYPLATQQVAIDLDDGVKVNYPKFGTALKKVKGLEAQ